MTAVRNETTIGAPVGAETTTRGLNVQVTVNAADQAVAYRALRRGLLRLKACLEGA